MHHRLHPLLHYKHYALLCDTFRFSDIRPFTTTLILAYLLFSFVFFFGFFIVPVPLWFFSHIVSICLIATCFVVKVNCVFGGYTYIIYFFTSPSILVLRVIY